MGLDISLLTTFTLVVDLGSFSGAARRQGLTQPAVSFQIKALEKELGATLFDRTHGKVVLTPAGRIAYRHARRILADRDAMMAEITPGAGPVSGRLMMAGSTIPAEYLLPPLVSEFNRAYPGVLVSLDVNDTGGVIERLAGEEIELGFVGAPTRNPDMAKKKFAEDRLVVITPPGHWPEEKKTVPLESLSGEVFVNRKPTSGTRLKLEAALAERGHSFTNLNVVAELGSTQSVISAVSGGMGISIVSSEAAERAARARLVQMYDVSDADLSRSFYAVYLKTVPLSVAAERFLELCGD